MSVSIVVRKLEELEQINKLKKCSQTSINKAQKLLKTKKCRKPTDDEDMKFVEAALSEKAVIITKDKAILDLIPYRCGNVTVEIIAPEDYL